MIELVPEGQGDNPRIALDTSVIEFINSDKVPTPPALNAYQCERRKGHIIVTIDIHPGVTPAFMGCKYPHCPGMSRSMFYPAAPMPDKLKLAPIWVWYRPSSVEFDKESAASKHHILQGGLEIRHCSQNFDQFMEEWNAHH
jgi:hypothetical protein